MEDGKTKLKELEHKIRNIDMILQNTKDDSKRLDLSAELNGLLLAKIFIMRKLGYEVEDGIE